MSQQWKPVDEQSWAMTAKSIKEDGPIGAKFLVFLNFWLNTAETMMAEPVATMAVADGLGGTQDLATALPMSPANAIRNALEVAEKHLGFIDVHFMGQLLVCIGTYWQYGDELCRQMSIIELKITGEALQLKLNEMGEQADGSDNDAFEIQTGLGRGHEDHVADAQESIDPLDESGRRDRDRPRPGDQRAGDVGAAQPGAVRQDEGRDEAPRNRLNERPGRKGGKPLDRRPSRASESGE